MKDVCALLKLHVAATKAIIDTKPDPLAFMKYLVGALQAFEKAYQDTFIAATQTNSTGYDVEEVCLQVIQPIRAYLKECGPNLDDMRQSLAFMALDAILDTQTINIKENAKVLFCTAPLRAARIELESGAETRFDKLAASIPSAVKRFVEVNMVKELPSFLNAVKNDAAEAVEAGRVNDPDGYKQLLCVLDAQHN